MIQTGLIESTHGDLVTDAAYDFYGLRLATCSLDQRIKVWQLDDNTRAWNVEDEWKAHDAAVSKVSWAHPEFGSIIASSSFDRTVKVWEQIIAPGMPQKNGLNGTAGANSAPGSSTSTSQLRWVERTVLVDARGTVRSVEFAPRHFGLKLATISSDSYLRIYECLEQASLKTWQLLDEIDINNISPARSVSSRNHTHIHSLSTPTQTGSAYEGGASASLVAQALANQGFGQSQGAGGRSNKEADGGWCISWCKERYWGEVIAVGCGTNGIVHIIQLTPSRRPTTLLSLDPTPSQSAQSAQGPHARAASEQTPTTPTSAVDPNFPQLQLGQASSGQQQQSQGASTSAQRKIQPFAVTSVSWAPSCGRSYHLVATGGRDGHVRIWRIKPAEEDADADGEDADADEGWSASIVADFPDHKSAVGRVEWNLIGTILSSVGNDGVVRLWKATSSNIWRSAGTIGVEHDPVEEDSGNNKGKDDMDVDRSVRTGKNGNHGSV